MWPYSQHSLYIWPNSIEWEVSELRINTVMRIRLKGSQSTGMMADRTDSARISEIGSQQDYLSLGIHFIHRGEELFSSLIHQRDITTDNDCNRHD